MLLLTIRYVVVVGTSRFEPVYRVLSFLVLGTALLIVSLVFTRLRKRRRPALQPQLQPSLQAERGAASGSGSRPEPS